MDHRVAGVLALLAIVGSAVARSVPAATYDQRQEGKVNVQIDVKDVQIVALIDSDMLEDYTNYDYAYDYNDFTVKPSSKPTTSKPPSTTGSSSSISSSVSADSTTSSTNLNSSDASGTTASATAVVNEESGVTKAPAPASTTIIVSPNDSPTANSTIILVKINDTSADETKIIEGVNNANKVEGEKIQQEASSEASVAPTTSSNVENEAKPDGPKRPVGNPEPRKRCPVGFLLKSGRCFKRRLSLISPRFALMKLAPALLNSAKSISVSQATQTS